MCKVIKIVALKKTCDAFPCQFEGTLEDGSEIYMRERGSFASITINGKTNIRVEGQVKEIFWEFLDFARFASKHGLVFYFCPDKSEEL